MATKVGPALPSLLLVLVQPEVDLIDQCRGLQSKAGSFPTDISLREPTQLVVDQRHQPRERHLVVLAQPRLGLAPGGIRRHGHRAIIERRSVMTQSDECLSLPIRLGLRGCVRLTQLRI